MRNVLTFKCQQINGGTVSLMPLIDGVALSDLITAFEREHGFTDPAGGYGGIVPSHLNLGPLSSYFLGRERPMEGDEPGEIYTLFCECGEGGCWPLITHVRVDEQTVVWESFAQPHRPKRDYSEFGSFSFDRADYEEAVAAVSSFGDVN